MTRMRPPMADRGSRQPELGTKRMIPTAPCGLCCLQTRSWRCDMLAALPCAFLNQNGRQPICEIDESSEPEQVPGQGGAHRPPSIPGRGVSSCRANC